MPENFAQRIARKSLKVTDYRRQVSFKKPIHHETILFRPKNELKIVSLSEKFENYTNIPLKEMKRSESDCLADLTKNFETVVCLCRRGNDSQLAVQFLTSKAQVQKRTKFSETLQPNILDQNKTQKVTFSTEFSPKSPYLALFSKV